MSPDDAFERCLASIYEAALDDAHWPVANALFEEASGAVGSMLVVGERCGKIYFTRPYYRGVVREDLAHEYFVNYYPHDEAPHRRRELPSGQMVHALELYTEEELKTSIAYNEGWRLLHGQNGVNINFRQPDGLHIFLGVGDPASGEWTSDALQMIERLGPHIQRAVIIRQALAAADALDAGPAGLMENDRIGVVQLDRGGRMLEANAVALEILHHGDGLVERDGTLNAVLPADRSRLRRLLASALPDFLGEAPSGGFETAETLPGLSLSVSPEVTSYGFWGAHGFAALTLGAGSLAAETDGTEYMGPGTAATSPWRRRTWPATPPAPILWGQGAQPVAAPDRRRHRGAGPRHRRAGLGRHAARRRIVQHRHGGNRLPGGQLPRPGPPRSLGRVRHRGPCRRVRGQEGAVNLIGLQSLSNVKDLQDSGPVRSPALGQEPVALFAHGGSRSPSGAPFIRGYDRSAKNVILLDVAVDNGLRVVEELLAAAARGGGCLVRRSAGKRRIRGDHSTFRSSSDEAS